MSKVIAQLQILAICCALFFGCAQTDNSDATKNPVNQGPKSDNFDRDLTRTRANPDLVTVSGISAGAYMATQLQIAFSNTFKGVASIAGGPWNCSNGLWWHATGRCMESPANIDIAQLLEDLKSAERKGEVDALRNLRDTRFYILNSPNDAVVKPPIAEKNAEFFGALAKASNLKFETAIAPGHAFPTLNYGLPCNESGSPFLSACNFDTAGALLQFLYPTLTLTRSRADQTSLHTFDQIHFDEGGASLGEEGWIYVPKKCLAEGTRCPLHVALHGCSQGADAINDVFVLHAGYNEWAEGSGLIILYPQTYARPLINPKGCFDWFGYTGSSAYATNRGPQMKAIKAMVDRLRTNSGH